MELYRFGNLANIKLNSNVISREGFQLRNKDYSEQLHFAPRICVFKFQSVFRYFESIQHD